MIRLVIDAAIAPLSETWRDSVRHAVAVTAPDGDWLESFAPSCFIRRGAGAEVQLSHDGPVVGHVNVVVNGRRVHVAEMIIEGDEALLERVKVGQAVSIDAFSREHDDDHRAGTRRHGIVELRHVAIAADGEKPWYPDAKIIAVRKLKTGTITKPTRGTVAKPKPASSPNGDWLAGLPDDWKQTLVGNKPGEVTALLGKGDRVEWKWNGRRFVAAAARLAA